MKPHTAGMLTLLASGQFYLADLYTITLIDGTVKRYCSGDKNIIVGGDTFDCGGFTGPYFKRQGRNSTIKWECGLKVSTLEFDVIPKDATINGIPFQAAVAQGVFDYADCLLQRALMPTYGDVSAGVIDYFNGLMGEGGSGRSSGIRFSINSYTDLLNINLPRNLIQPSCVNTLFDSACTLIKSSFGVAGTVGASSTVSSINATLSQASGYFDLGSLQITSGLNSGVWRAVKSYVHGSPSSLAIMPPLVNLPAPGDTFTVYPGCDKAISTCISKYDNLANFRGFISVPTPETAV